MLLTAATPASELSLTKSMRPLSFTSIACLTLLVGCYATEITGGYATPCKLIGSSDWVLEPRGAVLGRAAGKELRLYPSHEYSNLGPHLQIGLYASLDKAAPNKVRFEPKDISVQVDGQAIPVAGVQKPLPGANFDERCDEKAVEAGDLDKCHAFTYLFKVKLPPEKGFVLRLAKARVGEQAIDVPDVQFCYVPKEKRYVRLHG